MTVNGAPRWTCRTHVERVADDGRLRVGPLRSVAGGERPRGRHDGVLRQVGARCKAASTPPSDASEDFVRVPPASPARQRADAAIECIGCGVCYAACDVVGWNADYLGPAALNRAWSLVNDVRDRGAERAPAPRRRRRRRLPRLPHAAWLRHPWCPKHLDPTASIAGLKRATARAALTGKL